MLNCVFNYTVFCKCHDVIFWYSKWSNMTLYHLFKICIYKPIIIINVPKIKRNWKISNQYNSNELKVDFQTINCRRSVKMY